MFDICDYKTRKHHGRRVEIIPNFVFDDGECLYNYFERYLCGQWYVGNFDNGHHYNWWNPALAGSYGTWLSQGRSEFCTKETPSFAQCIETEEWISSYLFITPSSGKQFQDTQMSEYFARNSFRIIGKRITPHTFRYMWATFGGQSGLSDAQMKSLATAMGCTAATLQRLYERMSPTERNRPINDAMQKLLSLHAKQNLEPAKNDPLMEINEKLSKMSPEEMQKLRQFLGLDPAV